MTKVELEMYNRELEHYKAGMFKLRREIEDSANVFRKGIIKDCEYYESVITVLDYMIGIINPYFHIKLEPLRKSANIFILPRKEEVGE